MEHQDKKTPQNIKEILKDIGELSSLFFLYCHFNQEGYAIYRNYDEKGYDLILFNEKSGKKIKIEVKTRQRLISSAKNKNGITHFTLSENEKNEANFLIAYWLEYNYYFIVPVYDLIETKSNNNKLFKFIAKIDKTGELDEKSKKYLNNWKTILE
jgi:hypothetical protein